MEDGLNEAPTSRPAWVRAGIMRADRKRMRQNWLAGLAVVALIVAGYWLIEKFVATNRLVACLESGHRNCARLAPDLSAIGIGQGNRP